MRTIKKTESFSRNKWKIHYVMTVSSQNCYFNHGIKYLTVNERNENAS